MILTIARDLLLWVLVIWEFKHITDVPLIIHKGLIRVVNTIKRISTEPHYEELLVKDKMISVLVKELN